MTTIVRRMDDLGRVVIPKEMWTQLDLVSGTPIEIIGVEDGVLLRKKQKEPLCERVRRLREEAIREEAGPVALEYLDKLLASLEA